SELGRAGAADGDRAAADGGIDVIVDGVFGDDGSAGDERAGGILAGAVGQRGAAGVGGGEVELNIGAGVAVAVGAGNADRRAVGRRAVPADVENAIPAVVV